MRLAQLASGSTTRFAYDGLDRIAEYDGSNALLRRYVHGPNIDEPLVWYEGSGTTDRRFLSSDERGSVISVTDGSGTVLALNRYDEFGQPQAGNMGAFGYTGQAWLSGIDAWYYKARVYDPEPGRFLQPDPIGYDGDGPNLYAYVLNDPVNFTDPFGLFARGDSLLFKRNYEVFGGVTGSSTLGSVAGGGAGASIPCSSDICVVATLPVAPSFSDFSWLYGGNAAGGGMFNTAVSVPADGNLGTQDTQSALDAVVVTARRQGKLAGIRFDWNLADGLEQHWAAYSLTEIHYIGILGRMEGESGVSNYLPPRPGYIAIIHTHPKWALLKPGELDWGKSVPIYGIGYTGVWVIRPGETSATRLWGARPR
jgi:RHS repeat-associated protein